MDLSRMIDDKALAEELCEAAKDLALSKVDAGE